MAKRKTHYTITEAARRLGISRAAVYEAIRERRLKAIPRQVRRIVWQIPAASLRAYRISTSHQERGRKRLPARRRQKQVA